MCMKRIAKSTTEEEDPTGSRECLFLRQIRSVAVDMEDHFAGVVAEDGIPMGGSVIEQLRGSDGGGDRAI